MKSNLLGIWTIYQKEMTRTSRVIGQTIISPVITTSLYFVVFGAAVGSNIDELQGVSYGAFIIPGLIMLSLTTNSLNASSSGIYFPKWTGVIYELLTAPAGGQRGQCVRPPVERARAEVQLQRARGRV